MEKSIPVNRRIIVLASLMLLVVFIIRWWVPSDRSTRSLPALPDTRLDYTLTNFKSEFYNTEGALEWVIEAPELTHEASLKKAIISAPVMRIEPEGANWHARADQAEILRNEDEIVLTGNVIIRQPLDAGERIIKTNQLHHHRRQRTIRVESAVIIDSPSSFIEAGGLLIDLETNTMEFFNHVEGEIFIDHHDELSAHDDITGPRD